MAMGGVAVAVTTASVVPLPGVSEAEPPPPDVGIVCTDSTSAAGTASFLIKAREGRILSPDGNSVYMWSYSAGAGSFQYPGPMLCVTEGDSVTITLNNTLDVATSILFEGVEGVRSNDAPASVEIDSLGRMTSLIQSAPAGGSITYTFTAPAPGTYLYESGTDHLLQREMGLHGALIVRPNPALHDPTVAQNTVYGHDFSSFDDGQEYVHLFSQVDPSMHLAVERGQTPDFSTYRPRYFMINGRSFPDTIAPNNAPWLPNQPYGALVQVKPIGQGQTLPSVIRYVNASPIAVPFHPHSNSEEVIGIDARPQRDDVNDIVTSVDRFAVDVQAGQTVDARFSWTNTSWNPDNNPAVSDVPDARNLQDGGYWSGQILLGQQGTKPTGGDAFNQCGEYYHVAHNHALYAATNYGAAMGGQLTLVRVDPPEGC
jgi:FtsP/CotA-like multicopper oxidase with cupredoxin domain